VNQGQTGDYSPGTIDRSYAIHIAIHISVVYDVTVTAEAAGSSPVVPAILSKRVRQSLRKASRARKGRISPLFGSPGFSAAAG
jgi:hypothetical protein